MSWKVNHVDSRFVDIFHSHVAMGVPVPLRTPIAGWFSSWKIPFLKWMMTRATPMAMETPYVNIALILKG